MIEIRIVGARRGGKTATAHAISDCLRLLGYEVLYVGYNKVSAKEFSERNYRPADALFEKTVKIIDLG